MNEAKKTQVQPPEIDLVELKKSKGWEWATSVHPLEQMSDYWFVVLTATAYNEGLKAGRAEKEEASS
jgi:hypothetical protein